MKILYDKEEYTQNKIDIRYFDMLKNHDVDVSGDYNLLESLIQQDNIIQLRVYLKGEYRWLISNTKDYFGNFAEKLSLSDKEAI